MVLAAGTYRLDRPLVVLQDVTLRGAGQERTSIVSTAADAAILQAAPVRLDLGDLRCGMPVARPASVLLLRAGTTRLDRVRRRSPPRTARRARPRRPSRTSPPAATV